jgi:hypothetical protein
VPDRQVFRQIHRYGGGEVDMSRWPATVPAVAQILAEGLDLVVASWRQFLVRPQSFLRHLLDEPPA